MPREAKRVTPRDDDGFADDLPVKGLTDPNFDAAKDEREVGLRPQKLADFLGQARLKENLGLFMEAARTRKEALDHVFLIGPPGLGKTTLAFIVANELETECKVTSAPALEKPKDLAGILTTLRERSVLFIDEVHRLKPAIEEMLYIAMEDYELDWVIGQGPAARTIRIPVPPFTLIGATTKAGMVSSPLVSRFGIQLRFDYYEAPELAAIIRRSAGILGARIDEEAVELLSRSSRGTPRIANRILRRMRDFAQVGPLAVKDGHITEAVVREGLGRLEIDRLGLERYDRDILTAIAEKYAGGPVGAETLALTVGESVDTLEDYYEPYLIRLGFLMRTPRGRMITPAALEHLGIGTKREDERLLF